MNTPIGLDAGEMRDFVSGLGEPKFRAGQLCEFFYRKCISDFAAMTSLPKALREKLAKECPAPCRIAGSAAASDGAEKLLLELNDGETVEMVLIPASDGRVTFCLSTQVGCPVRCAFCASGAGGLVRNLTAAEMTGEFLLGAEKLGRVPDNVVFMGIGEGLLNFVALKKTLEILTDPKCVGMSPRRITVSTSGYVPGMKQFASMGKEFTLAISLHAPTDALRARLIPDFVRYPIAEILKAGDEYLEKSGRMVTYEYVLLSGVNDAPEQAKALAALALAHHAKINLIAYNATDNSEFKRPPRAAVDRFLGEIEATGAHVTLRVSKGADSAAACGQLRRSASRRSTAE